jgi:hypothetical protein
MIERNGCKKDTRKSNESSNDNPLSGFLNVHNYGVYDANIFQLEISKTAITIIILHLVNFLLTQKVCSGDVHFRYIKVLIYLAYKTLLGKKWALIVLTIYYALRSSNIRTDHFTFYTKSGLNIELGIGGTASINLLTLIFFILLLTELTRSETDTTLDR